MLLLSYLGNLQYNSQFYKTDVDIFEIGLKHANLGGGKVQYYLNLVIMQFELTPFSLMI